MPNVVFEGEGLVKDNAKVAKVGERGDRVTVNVALTWREWFSRSKAGGNWTGLYFRVADGEGEVMGKSYGLKV